MRSSGPRKRLRCGHNCRCFAPGMSFFIHTEADLDPAIARLVEADARFGHVLAFADAAAAAPPRRWLCRPVSIVVGAAAFDRQRRGDPRPADRGVRSARPAAVLRARADKLKRARALGAEDPHAQGHRQGDRNRRARSRRRSPRCRPTRRTRRSPPCTASVHGPPTSISCSASATPTRGRPATSPCRRPRKLAAGAEDAADHQGRWARSPNAGGRGARWRRACSGPIIARGSSARACWLRRRDHKPRRRRRKEETTRGVSAKKGKPQRKKRRA